MVKRAFENIFKTQNTIISAAAVLAVTAGLNALLGLIKNRLLTTYFGISNELSVFYTADRIPNLIYSVLVVGAISTVFIPIFTKAYQKEEKEAWKTAGTIINTSLFFFLLLGSIVFIFSDLIIRALSIGKFTDAEVALGGNLMRIMIAAQLLLVISSFLTSLLQSFKYFLIPALAGVVYNLGMIAGILFLSKSYGIYGPAYGIVFGSLLHLVIQLPLMKNISYKPSLSLNLGDKGIREMIQMVPARILSVVIANAISTVNNSLAILISTSSVITLKFATQLQFFPVSLFGLSIASAALPTLSMESDDNNKEIFKKTFLTSLHQMMFLVMPASIFLLVLRIPIVRLVYGVPSFPWEATLETARALAFFTPSIIAQSAIYLITRAYYALHDTLTPVKVSLATIFLNILLSLSLIKFLNAGVWAISFAFSVTSLIDLAVLLYFLSKKLGGFETKKLITPFLKISYAAFFMGLSLYASMKLLDINILDTSRTVNLVILTISASLFGGLSYLFFTKLFRVEEIQLFYKLLRKIEISQKQLFRLNIETNDKIQQ